MTKNQLMSPIPKDEDPFVEFTRRLKDHFVSKHIPVDRVLFSSALCGGSGAITVRTLSGRNFHSSYKFSEEIHQAIKDIVYQWQMTLDEWQREQIK